MRLSLKVITKSSRNELEFISDDSVKVYLTVVPQKGEANKKILKMLSKHFRVAKSNIKIISGEKSSNKVVEIED